MIRKAAMNDLARVAEILVFNYRLYFYPIFRNDAFYFGELQVPEVMTWFKDDLEDILVYDDGVVKGFVQIKGTEVKRLFVEPALHNMSIGAKLLDYAVREHGVEHLWALEKNTRAIAFYKRHGFHETSQRALEEDTTEYLVRMER